jgi:hypothetical protein
MKTQQGAGEPACHRGGTSLTGASPSVSSITHAVGIPSGHATDSKQTEKEVLQRKNFTQIQNCVIDSDLPETTVLGFIRFMRHCWKEGQFIGSIRKLCKLLNMARSTVSRMIGEWVTQGWVARTTQPRQEEEGEAMCLILLDEAIWQANDECYGGVPKTSSTVPNLDTTVPKTSKGVPERDHAVPKKSGNGPKTVHSVPPTTLKTGGNIGNMDSNTESNTGEEYRGASSARTTEPLPVLPSSLENDEIPFETIAPDTPHSLEAILAIGAHYLGDKVSRQDAEAFVRKTQSTATLVGAHEVRRQLCRNITFMLYSDHSLNWYRDKYTQVTLRSVTTHYDDYTRKAQKVEWLPPPDKLPSWYNETLSQQEDDYFSGMSEAEAASLTLRIQAEYPGLKISWGDLPGGRCTVGLWQGEEGQWCDLYKPWEWDERATDARLGAALDAYALVGVA